MDLKLSNKVIIITGAARGIGKEYALYFGKCGAKIVVNNRGQQNSENQRLVDLVVQEIINNGGDAIGNYNDIQDGDKIVEQTIQHYGRIDILINNAGIIRDSMFIKMSDNDWNDVINVHLNGTYQCCKAVWKYMLKQQYGRIINTISGSGLYGQLGQANYSAAKGGIIGLSLTLAKEGINNNIYTNIISPVAASRMTETILPIDMLDGINPQNVAPLIAYLVNENCKENGSIYECSGGYFSKLRLVSQKIDLYNDIIPKL